MRGDGDFFLSEIFGFIFIVFAVLVLCGAVLSPSYIPGTYSMSDKAILFWQFATTTTMKNIYSIIDLLSASHNLMYFSFLSEGSGRRRPPAERSA